MLGLKGRDVGCKVKPAEADSKRYHSRVMRLRGSCDVALPTYCARSYHSPYLTTMDMITFQELRN